MLGLLAGETPAALAAAMRSAQASAHEAAQEFIHSACRHLYFQRAEAQLLLRKLLFCAAELQSALAVSCLDFSCLAAQHALSAV